MQWNHIIKRLSVYSKGTSQNHSKVQEGGSPQHRHGQASLLLQRTAVLSPDAKWKNGNKKRVDVRMVYWYVKEKYTDFV